MSESARRRADSTETPSGLSAPHAFPAGEDLLEFLNHHFAAEAVLVDIGLPGMSVIEVVRRMHRLAPDTRLVLIHEDNDRFFEAN